MRMTNGNPGSTVCKKGWHLISSRVTGPQSFDQMVWPHTRGCVGLGRSHGRRGTGRTRVGFVYQRFSSSQHQDLFPPGKSSKTINRNTHYIVAFKNPRDQTGIRTILLQAFPDRWRQVLRPSCFGWSLSIVESFNAPRRSSASPHLARGCPCRSKTSCNENANVKGGKEKADNTLTYRPAWIPRPCLRQALVHPRCHPLWIPA